MKKELLKSKILTSIGVGMLSTTAMMSGVQASDIDMEEDLPPIETVEMPVLNFDSPDVKWQEEFYHDGEYSIDEKNIVIKSNDEKSANKKMVAAINIEGGVKGFNNFGGKLEVEAKSDKKLAYGIGGNIDKTKFNAPTELDDEIDPETAKDINIGANSIKIKVESGNRAEGIHFVNAISHDEKDKAVLDFTADEGMNIQVKSPAKALGVYTTGNTVVNLDHAKIIGDTEDSWGVDVEKNIGPGGMYSAAGLYAGSDYTIQKGGTINATNGLEITSRGTGVFANGGGAEINIFSPVNPIKIKVSKEEKKINYAVIAASGKVNINAQGPSIGNDKVVVQIDGNILASNGSVNPNEPYKFSEIAINLNNDKSYLHGLVLSNYTDEQINKGNQPINTLYVKNGAQWNNEHYGMIGRDKTAKSRVDFFTGGDSVETAGIILQNDNEDINIGSYQGHTMVIYKHNKQDADKIIGGDFKVRNVGMEGSSITLITDRAGVTSENTEKILNSLANKLYYTNAYKKKALKLNAYAEIAEGLTASAETVDVEKIKFAKENGQGYITSNTSKAVEEENAKTATDSNPVESTKSAEVSSSTEGTTNTDVTRKTKVQKLKKLPKVEMGSYETAVMKSVRAARSMTIMPLREMANNLNKRLGDIHFNTEKAGVWAHVDGGKDEYESGNIFSNLKYKAIHVGYDKKVTNSWLIGGEISQLKGDTNYVNGKGDTSFNTLGLYGSRVNEDGTYVDVITKYGRINNDYKLSTAQFNLAGKSKINGSTLSVETGRRIKDAKGGFFEPQVELIYGHAPKARFAMSDGEHILDVNHDSFNSLVSRFGVAIGKETKDSSFQAKFSMHNELLGKTSTTYTGEDTKKVDYDYKGTWFTIGLSGTKKLSDKSMLYADFEKGFSGDYRTAWKASVGGRIMF